MSRSVTSTPATRGVVGCAHERSRGAAHAPHTQRERASSRVREPREAPVGASALTSGSSATWRSSPPFAVVVVIAYNVPGVLRGDAGVWTEAWISLGRIVSGLQTDGSHAGSYSRLSGWWGLPVPKANTARQIPSWTQHRPGSSTREFYRPWAVDLTASHVHEICPPHAYEGDGEFLPDGCPENELKRHASPAQEAAGQHPGPKPCTTAHCGTRCGEIARYVR